MKATAHFSRSEAFAEDFGIDPDLTRVAVIDMGHGPWLNLTYNTLNGPDTHPVAWYNHGMWYSAEDGQPFSDVTIHFSF